MLIKLTVLLVLLTIGKINGEFVDDDIHLNDVNAEESLAKK